MEPRYHARFLKHYQKRIFPNLALRLQFEQRLALFLQNPRHPLLKDHPLKGKKQGARAFSLTGDCRVVYSQISANEILFLDIGTHNQVY